MVTMIDAEELLYMFRTMVTIREFEEAAGRRAERAEIPGPVHLYSGEEAVAVGVCSVLETTDAIVSTHRGHGHCIAKGANIEDMYAELFGRSTGLCHGKGGSMHIADLDLGILGANGIMGAGAPIATGAAFASKYNNEGRVAVCFSGDGATSQGAWHEALNLAAALELPVIFVIENNHYAVTSPYAEQTKAARLSDRALGYGMPGVTIDGMDVLAVHAAASEAVDRARAGGGPTLIECDTYRFNTHTGRSEAALDSRPAHEIAAYRERDPIEALQRVLEDRSLITAEGAERIILEVRDEIDEALTRSQTRPLPDPADLVADVYTPTTSLRLATDGPQPDGSERQISFREAISEALSGEMERDPGIFIVGTGDVFGLTRGIKETLGEGRIVNTPVSESAITGLGIGSAARGLRPLVSLMFMDFMAICFDQILNQMAKMKYMFGGKATLPLTVFVNAGAGTSMGSQHSQSLEALLCHIPGLKVVMPSTPADAKGLFTSAIRDDNPVFVIFPSRCAAIRGPVPEEPYAIPLGSASVVRPGDDLTIVATAYMVHEALRAADRLAERGISAEIVDPRSLQPLDTDTIVQSVRKTHRVLTVHEAVEFGGIGGEINAQIAAQAFDYLDAPPMRLAAPFSPVPYSPVLEQAWLVNADKIVDAALELVGA